MAVTSFSLAAQVLGMVMLIIGVLFRVFQPREINRIYGYRTSASMKNQDAWKLANRYAATLIIWFGAGLLVIGLLSRYITLLNENYAFAAILISIVSFILVAFFTEKRLKVPIA